MNGITFTGLRNIGGCHMSTQVGKSSVMNMRSNLILQLTDDFNGQDFTEFRNAIKKANSARWFENFPGDNRVIHIMAEHETDISKEFSETVPKLYLNYSPVPVIRETLGLFSFIAQLTKRIADMEDKDFKFAEDFKYGPVGRYGVVPHYDMVNVAKALNQNFQSFMNEYIFNGLCSRKSAELINESIKKQMTDYLK